MTVSFFKPLQLKINNLLYPSTPVKPSKILQNTLSHFFNAPFDKIENQTFLPKKDCQIHIIDQNNNKTSIKIQDLAQALHIKEKYLEQAIENNEIEKFVLHMNNALKAYHSETEHFQTPNDLALEEKNAHQLLKISAQAFFILKNTTTSERLHLSGKKFLIRKNEKEEFLISQKVRLLGSGTYGKASLYVSPLGEETVLKTAKNEDPDAVPALKNEYEILENVGGQRGIQDKPHALVNLSSSDVKKPSKIGYIGSLYAGSAHQLKRNPWTKDQVLDLMHQLFCGLNYLQDKKIRHQDIKPENIFYRIENGQLVIHISDFGGAQKMDTQSKREDFCSIIYTDDYTIKDDLLFFRELKANLKQKTITFEQFKEQIIPLFLAWDVFSTAISIYEILTGSCYDPQDSNTSINLEDFGLSKNLAQLVLRAFNKDYKQRPSCKEFLDELESNAPQLATLRT